MTLHIKKNDTVMVITGKDKGKKGKILKVFSEEDKVLVEGINIAKRHTRPRPPKVPQGGILDKPLPLSVSNVMLVCGNCGVPAKISYKIKADKTKERTCKKCGQAT